MNISGYTTNLLEAFIDDKEDYMIIGTLKGMVYEKVKISSEEIRIELAYKIKNLEEAYNLVNKISKRGSEILESEELESSEKLLLARFMFYTLTEIKEKNNYFQLKDSNQFNKNLAEQNIELTRKHMELSKTLKTAFTKTQNKISDLKGKLYADFVAILGVFTAIAFTIFGGLQLLANLFTNIKDISVANIGVTMIFSSLFLWSIYLLLAILLSSITKIIANAKAEEAKNAIPISVTTKIKYTCLFLLLLGLAIVILSKIIWSANF